MIRIKRIAALAIVLAITACSKMESGAELGAPSPQSPAVMRPATLADGKSAGPETKAANAATRRYLALSHHLKVEAEANAVQRVFDATMSHCEKLGCDILSANFTRQGRYASPSASLSVRVPPGAFDAFLSGLQKDVQVIQHQRESVDKTDAVIDAEARIKNMTELRDRLRGMLAARTANLKDALEVERELASTQAQLDTAAGLRKTLANQTDMVAVVIDFQSRQSVAEPSFFSPVTYAWNEAGRVFMISFGALITFTAGVLPWLLIIVPFFLLLRRFWRARKSASKS